METFSDLFYTQTILVILLTFVLFDSVTSEPNEILKGLEHSINISPLLENILRTFQNCEFVFTQQISSILSQNNDTASDDHNTFTLTNLQFAPFQQYSAGMQMLSVGANITFPRHKDIHRYTFEHCGVGVLLLQQFSHDTESWVVETLIPRYAPILRKDQDYFILIMPNEQTADQILLSPHFGSKTKYKLALFKNKEGITCKTVDLYGNGGNSQYAILRTFNSQELVDIQSNGNDVGYFEASNLFPDWTKYFHGKVFRFAIPKVAFRFEIEKRSDGKFHPKRGFYKWWLDEAMLKFNFTYDIFYASFGGGTGKRLKNGTWVGATGDIFYGKADCSFIVGEIYSRHKFLGWSSSISYEWVIFMTHSPRNSYSPKAIFKPFTPLMWSLFFLSLFVTTLALKSLAMSAFDPESRGVKWTYVEMFEYMFSTLMEQDQKCPLRSSSIRVLCSFWLLFAMVTATAFRGKLVSLIAFPVNTWVPTTFEELANSHFKVALNVVGKAGAAYVLIATSTSPVFKKLTERMELIPEAENCLERAMREDLGCIIWKGIADYAMVKNLTDKNGHVPLQDSSQIALFIGDGLVYERRAIFGEHFDRTIQASMQMGLTIKWFQLDQEFIKKERKVWEKSRNVSQVVYDFDDGPKKLIVSQFTGLFLLSFVCYLISVAQFLFELVQYKRKSTNKDNTVLATGDGDVAEIKRIAEKDHLSSAHESKVTEKDVQLVHEKEDAHINSTHNSLWHYTKL